MDQVYLCADVQKRIPDFLAERLSDRDQDRILEHLRECGACHRFWIGAMAQGLAASHQIWQQLREPVTKFDGRLLTGPIVESMPAEAKRWIGDSYSMPQFNVAYAGAPAQHATMKQNVMMGQQIKSYPIEHIDADERPTGKKVTPIMVAEPTITVEGDFRMILAGTEGDWVGRRLLCVLTFPLYEKTLRFECDTVADENNGWRGEFHGIGMPAPREPVVVSPDCIKIYLAPSPEPEEVME